MGAIRSVSREASRPATLSGALPLKPFPVREVPILSNSNKQHDLYLTKAWGKARASVPTLKCSINDVVSSIHEHDMRSPLSPESFFPGVVRGKAAPLHVVSWKKPWI